MMKHIFIFTSLFFVFLNTLYSISNQIDFTGKIDEIIEKKESTGRNTIYLKLNSKSNETFYIDDFFIVFLIEETHKILFSEYINKSLPKEISIKLENITIGNKKISDEVQTVIEKVTKVFPDYPNSESSYEYKQINPGIPEEDYYHRYVTVPVSYKDSEKGTFMLYYELCSDYDESKATIIIPTDGQRSLSQVGWADKYKKMFTLDNNTVTFEYRGMYASKIPLVENRNTDWGTLYEILNSDNVVEDIELIRKDLLGDKSFYVLGGSGTAMIGLKYISKYHEKVDRAYLMSFFKDAKGSSESGIIFFNNFLNENKLKQQFESLYKKDNINIKQTLFLIQRLLYYDKEIVKNMITELSENKFDLYNKYNNQLGSYDFFIRSAQKYRPWSVVFMYETNINTSLNNMPDINYPFFKMAEPVRDFFAKSNNKIDLFNIKNLEKIETEILLVAGTLDQVAPLHEMERIFKKLTNSEMAIFEAYHCLQSPKESKMCRNTLANLFFKTGNNSSDIQEYLRENGTESKFIEFKE